MPKKYFITRHKGATTWAKEWGLKARKVEMENFDPEIVGPGDVVMGTLPVHIAARVNERGGHYWHLTMNVPQESRGKELNAEQMRQFGARLEEFQIVGHGLRVSNDPDITEADARPPAEVQLCIASGQTLQNVLVMRAVGGWRKMVVFCTEQVMAANKERLPFFADAEQERTVRFVTIPGQLDYAGLRQFAIKEASKFEPGVVMDFNLTGGTKVMAMAFAEAFRSRARLLYCDTDEQQIQVLDALPQEGLKLREDLINLNDYLVAQGYRIAREAQKEDPELIDDVIHAAELTATLVLGHLKLADWNLKCSIRLRNKADGRDRLVGREDRSWSFIGLLHHLGSEAGEVKQAHSKKPFEPYVEITGLREKSPVGEFFDHLLYYGLIEDLNWSATNGAKGMDGVLRFKFSSMASAKYLAGGYLEEYVWLCLHHSGLPQEHFGINVGIGMRKKAIAASNDELNELDAAVVWRNKLWAFECKAGRDVAQGKDQIILNKLDRLKSEVGGTKGRAWLISARPLDATKSADATALQRAHNSKIAVIHGPDQLCSLPEQLSHDLGVSPAKLWKPLDLLLPGFQPVSKGKAQKKAAPKH
jgi:CRISPR-associated protein Csx16